MLRLLYITDTHGRATTPSSRLDDFSETVLSKMKYIGEFVKANNISAVIHGGDWLHTPDVSESFIGEFAKIVSDWECDVVGILGNHDIYGYNPDTFIRTPLGIAQKLNMFKRLYINNPYIIKNDDNTCVAITGCDANFNLDKNGRISDYTDSVITQGAVNIHVVHGMLVERVWPQVPCTTIEQIQNCNADIILTGHEHVGFEVKEMNGKLFCNPGSLLRVTSSTGDVRKNVSMALITVEGNSYNIEIIPLPSTVALPSSQVMDLKAIAEEKESKKQLEHFTSTIISSEVSKSFNIYDSLNDFCNKENIEEEVKDVCRQHLEQAEELIKKGEC